MSTFEDNVLKAIPDTIYEKKWRKIQKNESENTNISELLDESHLTQDGLSGELQCINPNNLIRSVTTSFFSHHLRDPMLSAYVNNGNHDPAQDPN